MAKGLGVGGNDIDAAGSGDYISCSCDDVLKKPLLSIANDNELQRSRIVQCLKRAGGEIMKFVVVFFLASVLLPSLAHAGPSDGGKTLIPKEFIKINIPSGISSIDLRGTGKADDRVINSDMFEGGRIETNITVFLTGTENDSLPFYFVGMPKSRLGGALSSFSAQGSNCAIWHTSFLRDANNLKNVYMLTTYRSAMDENGNAMGDNGNGDASFKITLYNLTSDDENPIAEINGRPIKPSEKLYYTFAPIRTVSIPHYKACSYSELEKLEQDALKIKVKG